MSLFIETVLPITGVLLAAVVSAIIIVVDWAKDQWRKRFREQLKKAVIRQMLTYSDLQHIAERWYQDRQAVLQALRIILAEAIAGEEDSLAERIALIRQLLLEHQSKEPYAELPENISLQLASLMPSLPERPEAITQLAASLSVLYSKNQRDLARQKRLAIWGFLVGILGLLTSLPGIYALFKT
jgi:hypothetical protein